MGIQLPADQMLAAILAALHLSTLFRLYSWRLPRHVSGFNLPRYAYDLEALLALSIVMHGVLLVFWFGLGIWGLKSLNLKFSDFGNKLALAFNK